MVNMADSAAIRQNIPTRPREGRIHADSGKDDVKEGLLNWGSPLHSYFQSGSSGCLMSQRGRRLLTTGMAAKLYSGGGELVDHSSVHASQGSLVQTGPLTRDQSKLQTNTRIPAA